jgi:hypothetical protein
VIEAILLLLGMAIVGVRVLGVVVMPIAGGIVERKLDPDDWLPAMTLVSQATAFAATFAIGLFGLGGPWWAALIVGFLVASRPTPCAPRTAPPDL